MPRKSLILAGLLAVCLVSGGCYLKMPRWDAVAGHERIKPRGNVILALFDGSEKKTKKDNEIKKYLEDIITGAGFEIKYFDVNRGIPSKSITKNIRGIVTWFGDSKMKKAEHYCKWLAGEVKNGKKVVIFDNFGAYQDKKSSRWMSLDLVNGVFGGLGVLYKSGWTDKSELLEVVDRDGAMVEKTSSVDLARSAHYYLFEKESDKVTSYLTVKRKDMPSSESVFVFSSPSGGMALTRYIMGVDAGGNESPNIDFQLFLDRALFGGEMLTQRFLVVLDNSSRKEKIYLDGLLQVLDFAKMKADILYLKDLDGMSVYDIRGYSSLLLITEGLWKLGDANGTKVLREYVTGGGGLFVMHACYNEALRDVLGIKSSGDFYQNPLKGLKISANFFPGSDIVFYPENSIEHEALDVSLEEDARVLAASLNSTDEYPDGVPVAWTRKCGKGSVVFWNSDCLMYVNMRGILLQSLLMAQPVAAYSLCGIENVQIDDFPMPMYNVQKEPIKTSLGMTDTEFYVGVWWKDMLSLSKKYGIMYSCYVIFNYDDNRKPPFRAREFEFAVKAFTYLVKSAVSNNFEIGLHGYNHQSLMLKGVDYEPWRSGRYMAKSLEEGRGIWLSLFPETEEPFSYVAPMNVIDKEGKRSIRKVFPSIKVISKLFSGEEEGVRFQEFGPDPDDPYFFDIPRVTGGYIFSQKTKNELVNSVVSAGIWTHFFHPDDVFGKYSLGSEKIAGYGDNGETDWASMISSADSMFAYVRANYPWVKNMSTKDAYWELVRYYDEKCVFTVDGKIVTAVFSSGSSRRKLFAVRAGAGSRVSVTEGCSVAGSYPESGVYVFETYSNFAKVELSDEQ